MSTHSTRLAYLGSLKSQHSVWSALRARVGAMILARRTRRLLAGMDDRMLADIGVGRGDALFESNRSMWDIDRRV